KNCPLQRSVDNLTHKNRDLNGDSFNGEPLMKESKMPDSTPPSRRTFLLASGAGMALSGLSMPFHASAREAPVQLDKYKPEYFEPEEWSFILAATARLIPSDGDGPGALETNVPVFIDRQLAGNYGSA